MSIIMAIIAIMLFSATASTHAQEIVSPNRELIVLRPPPPEESEEQTSPPIVTETPLEEPAAETPPKKIPPAVRQEGRPYGAIFQMSKRVRCNDTPVVEKFITEGYKEIPLTIGVLRNKMAIITNIFMVYVHPKTRAFSIVEHAATGISCILAEGTELELMNDPNIINPNFKGEDYAEQWPQIDPSK